MFLALVQPLYFTRNAIRREVQVNSQTPHPDSIFWWSSLATTAITIVLVRLKEYSIYFVYILHVFLRLHFYYHLFEEFDVVIFCNLFLFHIAALYFPIRIHTLYLHYYLIAFSIHTHGTPILSTILPTSKILTSAGRRAF